MRTFSGCRSLIAMLLVVVSGVLATPGHAQSTPPAATVPRFNIQPVGDYPEGFFSVELAPGESVSLMAAVVTAPDSAPVALRTYGANAINAVNGGFAAGSDEDTLTGAGTWLAFPSQRLDLGAGERVEIPFTISVPEGTAPGQYVAALVAQTNEPIPIPGMDTFNQIVRSAVGVTIVVPGQSTYGFTTGQPVFMTDGGLQLSLPITNTGTWLVRPEGTLQLSTPDGEEVASFPVEMKAVYGGLATSLQIPLPAQIEPGDYVLTGTLADTDSGVSVEIEPVTMTLADANQETTFAIDAATVQGVGDPVQFADVSVTMTNSGEAMPTATVTLEVSKDGEILESYPLAQNQALPTGSTTISQRYIPAGGWTSGTWSFTVRVSGTSLETGANVELGEIAIEQPIMVP